MAVDHDHGLAGPVPGNDRIVRILDALATQPRPYGWGVRELAGVIGEDRSTVNRILKGLVERRLADVDSAATYRTGPRLRVLAGRLHRRHAILSQAPALLVDLAARSDATIMVVLQGPTAETGFIAVLHERHGPVRYQLTPGMLVPLHAGAAGKAVLSLIGLEVLNGVDLQRFSQDTIVDREQLAADIAVAQEQGYLASVGQHIPLAAGVAAPFVTAAGERAAVSATRPRYSTTDDDLAIIGPLVRDTATALARLHPIEDTGAIAPNAGGSDATALGRFERLLAVLSEHPSGIPSRDLVGLIGANLSTVARLQTTAEVSGIARSTPDEHVAAGPLLLRWAAALGPRPPLPELLVDDLTRLATDTGETAALTVFDHATSTAVMTTVVPGPNPIHYGLAAGSPVPLHAGAAGKAILAHADPELVEKQTLDRLTPRTPTTRDQLDRDLDLVRARGWAEADGERIPDAFGLAAPFFDGTRIAGSVTLTTPRFRRNELDIAQLCSTLTQHAARISRLLSP